MESRKILFVITKSNWGGAQAYVFALATQFAAKKYEVVVALGGTGLPGAETGQLAERLTAAGIQVVRLNSMVRDISFTREFRSFQELERIIRIERPDILHLNSSKAGILGALAGRRCKVPRIVFTAHGWPHREPRPFFMRSVIWIASWLTVYLSHAIIAVSACDYRTAPVFFSRKKIHIVRNGIAPFSLHSRSEARAVLAPSLSSDTYWFQMHAELHPNKGIDRALRAFSTILPSYPQTRLVIVGDGQERGTLQDLADTLGISAQVVFAGFVPDARSYLAAADCYLMPSRKEGLPMALLEAGVASLPVIASATGGIPEVISDHENGLLIPPEGDAPLVTAMRALLDTPERARDFGAALHQHVTDSFSETRMVTETEAAYR